MTAYEARRNYAETTSTFEISGGNLVRSENGAPKQQVALGEVRRVRITYQPSGVVAFWLCRLETPHGHMKIPSASFTGFGRAVDQRAAYRVFIQALTQAIANQPAIGQAGATPVFTRGGGWQRPFFLVMLILFGVLSVLLLLGLIGTLIDHGSITWVLLPMLAMLIGVQTSWRSWRSNPPAAFDPNALPADIGA